MVTALRWWVRHRKNDLHTHTQTRKDGVSKGAIVKSLRQKQETLPD